MRLETNPETMQALLETLGAGKRESRKAPDPLVQIIELRSRWDAIQEATTDFKPGDLCVEKEGFASNKLDGQIIYVYWGAIDHTDPMHKRYLDKWVQESADFEPTDDCFIGFVIPESKGAFIIRPYTRARLRALSADETRQADSVKEVH